MERIPKKIHYCWFGGKPKSNEILACIESWQKALPDYEIIEWNEANYNSTSFFFSKSVINKKFAFASDYARLDILYNHGGIYLDTDMLVIKSFDNLLHHHSFWGMESEKSINSAILGSEKGNPILRALLDELDDVSDESFFNGYTIVILATNYFLRNKYKIEPGDQGYATFFAVDYFYPFPFNGKGDPLLYKTSNTYAIHLWSASWFSAINRMSLCLYKGERKKAWIYFFKAIAENVNNFKALPIIIKKTFKRN